MHLLMCIYIYQLNVQNEAHNLAFSLSLSTLSLPPPLQMTMMVPLTEHMSHTPHLTLDSHNLWAKWKAISWMRLQE